MTLNILETPPVAIATLLLNSPQDTQTLAQKIGAALAAGHVICLEGGVGAGKTHFARALIQGRLAEFDQVEDVPSPTFTLVQTYQAGALEIWHADLYRLSDPGEVDELGLIDAFDSALCLIEWPDRIQNDIPQSALWISIAMDPAVEDRRVMTIASALPEFWKDHFQDLSI